MRLHHAITPFHVYTSFCPELHVVVHQSAACLQDSFKWTELCIGLVTLAWLAPIQLPKPQYLTNVCTRHSCVHVKGRHFDVFGQKLEITHTLLLTIFLHVAISIHTENQLTDLNLARGIHLTKQRVQVLVMQLRPGIVSKTWCWALQCFGFQLQLVKSSCYCIRKL